MVGVTAALDFTVNSNPVAKQLVKVTPTPIPVQVCPAGYDCMLPDMASEKGYVQYTDTRPCGYLTTSIEMKVPEYCYRPALSAGAIAMAHNVQTVVPAAYIAAQPADTDKDGVPDISDNCPNVYNPDQNDSDNDTVGNACDNCWYVSNPDQKDINGTCRHLNFVSEYYDATRNAWIKDPACGDACSGKPVLRTNNPPVVVARPPGAVGAIAAVPVQPAGTQTPGTAPTSSLGTLVNSPLLHKMTVKSNWWDSFLGAVLCPGKTSCTNGCADLKTDVYNCGGCGNVCPPGPAGSKGAAECINGQCIEHTCPNSQIYCSGQCADVRTDTNNCGTCGVNCNGTCLQGNCLLTGMMTVNKKPLDVSKIVFLTPEITQERYWSGAGSDLTLSPDGGDTAIGLNLGDGYPDDQGWFVGTDSTMCEPATHDLFSSVFPIYSGSPCDSGDNVFKTLDYRVKMLIDTSQFNGKPVQKAILKLSVAKTYEAWGDAFSGYISPEGQTIHEVWYKKQDFFPVSFPESMNNLDPYRGIYLANIPTAGIGENRAASPPVWGSPATGGQVWGTGAVSVSGTQPQATWDPQARTLTIDMTDLVNEWITGHTENHGLVLKDGAGVPAKQAWLSVYTFDSFEVVP
ncbi:MAG: thrombospondin type 3 repeat-containing protein [Methanoregula sp.]